MEPAAPAPVSVSHAERMDRNYRLQRHVYDLTRKYYLFGRDRLVRVFTAAPGDTVAEVGCGTARNLLLLARRHPHARFYGVDASAAMLETAQARVAHAGLGERIILKQGLGEEMNYNRTFGLDAPFSSIFFSYAVSMIPPWRESLLVAWNNLRSGGTLWVVDFWDQAGLPAWFRWLLRGWLARFHTHPRAELLDYLRSLPGIRPEDMIVEAVGPRYALLAQVRKP